MIICANIRQKPRTAKLFEGFNTLKGIVTVGGIEPHCFLHKKKQLPVQRQTKLSYFSMLSYFSALLVSKSHHRHQVHNPYLAMDKVRTPYSRSYLRKLPTS